MARRGANIYKRKDGRWEGRYIRARTPEGKAIFRSVYGRTYKEAQLKLFAEKARIGREAVRNMIDFSGSFCDWSLYWLEELTRPFVRESTYAGYRRNIEKHLLPLLGDKRLADISDIDVQHLVSALSRQVLPSTLHGIFRLLKSIFREAVKKDFIFRNPCEGVRLPRFSQRQPRFLSQAEQKQLEKQLKYTDTAHQEYIVCLYTGMRLGEVCALRWEDIDFISHTILVNKTLQRIGGANRHSRLTVTRPKTYFSERSIPMPPFIARMMKEKKSREKAGHHEVVFQSRQGSYIDPHTMQRRLKKLAAKAGLKGVHMHTLRHTFAVRCLERRVGYETLCRILGHSSPSITLKSYSHSTREQIRKAMQGFQAMM